MRTLSTSRLALLAAVLLCSSAGDAIAQTGGSLRINGASGQQVGSSVVPKGVPARYTAVAVDGAGNPIPVEWHSAPEGVLQVAPGAYGAVTVTPLRDAFDDPQHREPVARLQACTPTMCAAVTITVVPDLTGRWPTTLDVEGLLIPHSENRNLVFVQNGREVTFDPEPTEAAAAAPARMATIRIDGDRLRLVRNGSIMTVFEGRLTSRTTASGRWSSSRGYHGSWSASKAP
ncbi:MAG TPA: hypothetical protein VL500_07210 [Candidatus Eisenbacteria bacterium]|nr:hypothetical protein [Candidatus Eisenbacteria bacterium]